MDRRNHCRSTDVCGLRLIEARIATRCQGKVTNTTSYRNHRNVGEVVKISTIEAIASFLGRYGLVVVIGWIGALKFANFQAHQIQPLVANSPFMGWLYNILPVYTFSALLGVFEVDAAALIAIKPLSP
jgi:reactive chlorine resistance protein C